MTASLLGEDVIPTPRRATVAAVLETEVFDLASEDSSSDDVLDLNSLAAVVNRYLSSDDGEAALERAVEESDRQVKRAVIDGASVGFELSANTLVATLHVERVTLDIGKRSSSKRQYTARIDDVEYEFRATVAALNGAPLVVVQSGTWIGRGRIDIDAQRLGAAIVQAFRTNDSERAQMEAYLHDAAGELKTYLGSLVLMPLVAIWSQQAEGSSQTFAGAYRVPPLGELLGDAAGSASSAGVLDLRFELLRAELERDHDRADVTTRVALEAFAAIEPRGGLRSGVGTRIPGAPLQPDLSEFGVSGSLPVQAQLRWDLVNEFVYAYWATGAMDDVVLSSDRLGDVSALAGLPDFVRFRLDTLAPPTFTGGGAGRVQVAFPGITLTASVGSDPIGACTAVSHFLPFWVRLGLVAEADVATAGGASLSLTSIDVSEVYVSADDWSNLMIALVFAGTADLANALTTDLGPVDEGIELLLAEIIDALLGALPLDATLPSIPLGGDVLSAVQSVVPGASALGVSELLLGSPSGTYVDLEAADRSRILFNADLELR